MGESHAHLAVLGVQHLVDHLVALDVRQSHVAQGVAQLAPLRLAARRGLVEQIRLRGVHVRLVDGHPVIHHITEELQYPPRKPQEQRHVLFLGEGTQVLEPQWVVEVVQSHQWLDAAIHQVLVLRAIALQRLGIEIAAARPDARPLHGHASDLQPQVAHQLVILLPPVPVIGRGMRTGAPPTLHRRNQPRWPAGVEEETRT